MTRRRSRRRIRPWTNLFKTLGALAGIVGCWFLVFRLFTPAEVLVATGVSTLATLPFLVQYTEWPVEHRSLSILGLTLWREERVYGQLTVLGIFPMPFTQPRLVSRESEILSGEEWGDWFRTMGEVVRQLLTYLPPLFGPLLDRRRRRRLRG